MPQQGYTDSRYAVDKGRPIEFFKTLPDHHPILGVPVCKCEDPMGPGVIISEEEKASLLPKNLSDAMIRRMINFSPNGVDPCQWASAYGYCEICTGSALCKRLIGMSKKQVIGLLGQPAFRDNSELCQPDLLGGRYSQLINLDREQYGKGKGGWLYFFGGIPILVRITFKNGICDWADSRTYHEDPIYCAWEDKQLRQYALGKRKKQIVDKFGEGLDGACNSPSNRIPVKQWRLEGSLKSTDKDDVERIKRSDELMRYQFGDLPAILTMVYYKNGNCWHVDDCNIGSVTLGWPTWTFGCRDYRFIRPK